MTGLSVVIPTLNCMALLPAHLQSIRRWLDLAYEIIVVDSHSTDGTPEYILRELSGFPVKIVTHPRGLYQSWNHGVSLARGEWIYISTVGDSITRELILHLHAVATASRSDIALSLPTRVDEQDALLPLPQWAITEITSTIARCHPRVLTRAAALYYAIRHYRSSALLGSTASNLYRTSHLQARPFPVEFGTAGDAAWSMLHSFETRYAFTPVTGSTFRIHKKSYDETAYVVEALHGKILQRGLDTLSRHAADEDVRSLEITTLHYLSEKATNLCIDLQAFRKTCRPWFLYPRGWQLRSDNRQAYGLYCAMNQKSLALIQESLSAPVHLPP